VKAKAPFVTILVMGLIAAFCPCSHAVEKLPPPYLHEIIKNPVCGDAYEIAKEAFHSEKRNFFFINDIPAAKEKLVLYPGQLDMSGGDSSEMIENFFEKMRKPEDIRSIYWQKRPNKSGRLVFDEHSYGWRGDQYTVFLIPDWMTPEDLVYMKKPFGTYEVKPFIETQWNYIYFFKNNKIDPVWILVSGRPLDIFKPWEIYAESETGMDKVCEITFLPKDYIIPRPVKEMKRLLFSTLGSGENEGTLQPTARIRLDAENVWQSILYRPWVTGRLAYNSREEVDNGLKAWSKKSPDFLAIYRKIEDQYPRALQALKLYYITNFNKSDAEAQLMAEQNLDKAYTAHFVFPK
jgi:hypothetical protein